MKPLKDHIKYFANNHNMTQRYKNSFFVFCQQNWVNLDERIKQATSIVEFNIYYLEITAIRK